MFFDEKGILNIDELVASNNSYKKIMEDCIVTDEELKEQSDKVLAILRNIEQKHTDEELKEIKELLTESSVLYAIYQYYSIQTLKR
ncbi:MAG: hypothetical protein J6V33_06165 [Bacteroidales bacterium]|nr:hypothetical protein [Bacteroidales bacterium]